jgi:plasmid stability protein
MGMVRFIIRDVEEDVIILLKRRAQCHGRSVEEEIRHILGNAVMEGNQPASKLGSRIAARFKAAGLTGDLPQKREALRATDFGK